MTRTVLLGDIAQINPESIGNTYKYNDIQYLDTSSVTENSFSELQHFLLKDAPSRAKRIVRDKDIIYSTVRPTLKHFGYISNPAKNMVASTGFAVVRAGTKIYPLYLYYWLSTNERTEYLTSIVDSQTSTFPAFNPSVLSKFEIDLPELDVQKKIADILGTIDKKIELNRRMNETLEQMGQALFRHYFIDNREADDWDEKSLDEIADFLNGVAMQKFPDDGGPTLPVIKIREMSRGITSNTDIGSANIPEKYIVHDGDILFSWSGTLIVKPWCDGEGALNQHLFKVTSHEHPKWFYYYWTKYHLQSFIETAAGKATTMGHIQRQHLTAAKVKVPPVSEFEKINRIIEPFLDQQITNELENRKLASLRDSLLPRLISGKVKV